jgi:sugar phosphate isomerase/epimerase
MKLGVFTPVVSFMGLEEALKYLSGLGVQAAEMGTGGYPGDAHLKPAEIIGNPAKIAEIKGLFEKYNIELAAVSTHNTPLHPQKETAEKARKEIEDAILTAEALGVETVVGFSGCPGDCENSKYPNWATCSWPNDFLEILDWQWNEVAIPYWKKTADFAKAHGVKRIAFEMHPGFLVYNVPTLLKLRAAVGDVIGANFDPSHLYWQGVEPVEAIRALKGAIYHFHAKDTRIDARNTAVNGVLDTQSYADIEKRSFVFRTVGYAHGKQHWNDIISALKLAGYDGVVSIEHEDGLMSPKEGLEKAVAFLKDVLIYENAGEAWWI